jgi:hypothetical protein
MALATASWAATSSSSTPPDPGGGPPPGITSINSHPIGTVGSAIEGQGGMAIISTP